MKTRKMRRIISLVLAIGITGGLGSVAYFSDKENVNGDLKLTLGTLSSEATKTIKIEKMDIEVPVSDNFIITNNGTLDQIMTLNFKNSSIGNDGLEKIKYSLSFESSENRDIQGYGNGEETLLSLFDKNIKGLKRKLEELKLERITVIDEKNNEDETKLEVRILRGES